MKYIIDVPEDKIEINSVRTVLAYGDIKMEPYNESEAEQCGADKAWKLACHLYNVGPDVTGSIYLSMNGGKGLGVALEMPYAEAQAKYDAWEKEKYGIHIGDEVAFENGSRFVVYDIFQSGGLCGCGYDYYSGRRATWSDVDPNVVRKTGRHFGGVEEVLEQMKEPE